MWVYLWIWKTVDDYSAMQWPCAEGFHVPTSSEWSAVRTAWINMGAWTSSWSTSITNIKNYLKIPLPWRRASESWSYDGMWNSFWEYWTCTSNWIRAFRLFIRNDSSWKEIFAPSDTLKPSWLSIRPFKDVPVIPDNSWTKTYSWTWTAWIYHNSSLWLISISSDWTTRYTIADKNLWATTVYSNWASLSEANCGKFYQRWNNYWFPYSWSVTTSTTPVDASNYWPWNYYSSSTFICWTESSYNWDSSNNDDLRWWVTGVQPKTIYPELKNAYIGEVWTPTSNTLAYYKFDWNLNDISWNSRNLSMSAWTFSYSTLTSWAKYVQTNKNAYSTEISDLPFSQSAYTVSFRLSYANWITNTEWCTVIEMWNSSNILRPVLYWASTSINKFTVMNTGLSYTPSVSNSWHYYTITLDGSNTKLYVDWVLQWTTSLPWITASTVYFRLNTPKWVNNTKMTSENKLSELIFENQTWDADKIANYYNSTKWNYWL